MKLSDLLKANTLKSTDERNIKGAEFCIARCKEEAEKASLKCEWKASFSHPDLQYGEIKNLVRKALEAEGIKISFSQWQLDASSDQYTYFVEMSWAGLK